MALDWSGNPALLVPAEDRRPGVSLRAKELSLRTGLECSLHVTGNAVHGRFHVLECAPSDEATAEIFILLVDALLNRLTAYPTKAREEILSFFRTLRRLFSVSPVRSQYSQRQGLWGELFVMRETGGATAWAPFWHTDPYRRFDLSGSRERIEVKTTQGTTRTHHFSHRQLYPAGKEQIVIASLVLTGDSEGLTLRSLINETRDELSKDPAQLAKLEAAVRGADMSAPEMQGPSFNEPAAAASLAWFWTHELPRFAHPEPPGVSNTTYIVDLSGCVEISGAEIEQWLNSWETV